MVLSSVSSKGSCWIMWPSPCPTHSTQRQRGGRYVWYCPQVSQREAAGSFGPVLAILTPPRDRGVGGMYGIVLRILKGKLLDHLDQSLPYSLHPEIEGWEVCMVLSSGFSKGSCWIIGSSPSLLTPSRDRMVGGMYCIVLRICKGKPLDHWIQSITPHTTQRGGRYVEKSCFSLSITLTPTNSCILLQLRTQPLMCCCTGRIAEHVLSDCLGASSWVTPCPMEFQDKEAVVHWSSCRWSSGNVGPTYGCILLLQWIQLLRHCIGACKNLSLAKD
jgi:hypothetical protein